MKINMNTINLYLVSAGMENRFLFRFIFSNFGQRYLKTKYSSIVAYFEKRRLRQKIYGQLHILKPPKICLNFVFPFLYAGIHIELKNKWDFI